MQQKAGSQGVGKVAANSWIVGHVEPVFASR
jgi:hypothetical protein